MHKLAIRLTLSTTLALLAVFGCAEEGTSPTAPALDRSGLKLFDLPPCGESTYLTELSLTLPAWSDSIETWLPGTSLNETPAYAGGDVGEHLGLLIPALQQWQAAINAAAGEILGAVPGFDAGTMTTQAYLGDLSSLLAAWKLAMETARGREFLTAAPVFVADTFAPMLACPGDTTLSCPGAEGVVFEFEVTAGDDCDTAPVVVCEPASGSSFPIGVTTVTCTATDASGNSSSCSFTVTVGSAPPMLACPGDTTLSCAGEEGLVFAFEVTASDDCDAAPVVVCEPASGSSFPVGVTTVTCTATDTSGNSSSCSFAVTVEPAEVDIESIVANPAVLWPPNHKMVDIGFVVDADNACEVELTCTVLEVRCNESVNGHGDGNTEPDWILASDGSLSLRAERSGMGHGRVYEVLVRCEDSAGDGDERWVKVVVPHDQGGGR